MTISPIRTFGVMLEAFAGSHVALGAEMLQSENISVKHDKTVPGSHGTTVVAVTDMKTLK